MHGTVVMLMALSGLGCHYKHADVVYTPSCYSGVSDACYSSCYSSSVIEPVGYSSCYGSSYYESCYSESCYSSCYSGRKHGFLKKCFAGLGGLFKKHHRAAYYEPVMDSCYSSCYSSSCYTETYASCYSGCYSSGYAPAVFGSSAPIYDTQIYGTPAPAPAGASAAPVPVGAGAAPAATTPAPAGAGAAPAGTDLYRGGQPAGDQLIDTPPAPPAPAGAAPNATDLTPNASDLVPGDEAAGNVKP